MFKYITAKEMVKVFNVFTRYTDPNTPLLWVGSLSLGGRKIIVEGQAAVSSPWVGAMPAAELVFSPEGYYLPKVGSSYGSTSVGYRPEEVIEVEFTSFNSKSILRWTRFSCSFNTQNMGVLEYVHGTDPSYRGRYFDGFQAAESV